MIEPKNAPAAKNYQIRAVEQMSSMGAVLLADPPGAGKSLMTIQTINQKSFFDDLTVLIVAPASIKFVWETEIEKWSIPSGTITVISGKKGDKTYTREFVGHGCEEDIHFGAVNYTIVNYDICHAPLIRRSLMKEQWDVIVFDEAHMLKTVDSKRSKVCLGCDDRTIPLISKANKIIAITGTPLNNHVIDLWPLLTTLAPQEFGTDFERFAYRYCNPRPTDYGMDYTGAANLDELNLKMRRSCMIRRKKEVILPELPKKEFSMILVDPDSKVNKLLAMEDDELRKVDALALKGEFRNVHQEEILLDTMSTVRKEMALAKVPHVLSFIKNLLDNTNEKVVILGYHTEALETICAKLEKYGSVILTGKTTQEARRCAVEDFQTKKSCRVFVGNIKAAGTGITLTASRRIFFSELDWNPSSMLQGVDRVHRIGQDADRVLIQYMCFRHSLEASIGKSLEKKSKRIETAIDQGSTAAAIKDMS